MPFPIATAAATAGLAGARKAARALIAQAGKGAAKLAAPVGAIAAGGVGANMLTRAFTGGGSRRRRGRGITACELRGARKVANLVRMYGMRPKTGKIRSRRR